MSPRVSRRMAEVQAPVIPVVAALAQRHPGTLSLGQGVAYYGPPPAALERAQAFLAAGGEHRYGPVQGQAELIAAIAHKLGIENRIDCAQGRRIVVTAGANMGFLNALWAITDPGDEVILPSPYYFNQEMAARMLSCRPVPVPADPQCLPTIEGLARAITARSRAIVTVSPNNPSGAVYPEPLLCAINTLCRDHGLYHITDEAYEYFTFGDTRHFSPAALRGSEAHTISLFSLSKAYGFAGWRIGYMVLPEHLYEAVLKAQDTNLICATGIAQHAALGALESGRRYCESRLPAMQAARDAILARLREIGELCSVGAGQGALYLLVKVHTGIHAMRLVERLIERHRVAVIPGHAFGIETGCYFRVSYGNVNADLAAEGARRLVEGLKDLVRND